MLGQLMIAIQKPGDARVCRYSGAAVFCGRYSCLPSQIDAIWDFRVHTYKELPLWTKANNGLHIYGTVITLLGSLFKFQIFIYFP